MSESLTCKYEPTQGFSGDLRRVWSVVGQRGGVHVWIEDAVGDRVIGGIELHSRTAPEGREGTEPDHDNCWLLNGPCWHDGSSLAADEVWIPFWRDNPGDHGAMFDKLQAVYRREFGECKETA